MRGRHTAVAAATGVVLGALAVGPGLAPGFVLSYDMVFVPHPVFRRWTFGLTGMLPRHVPSDAVVTALAHIVPAEIVQKVLLLAVFVIATVAAAHLTPSERLLPRLAAGVVYAWNPFVAERLLLGQWALLLGYAALPLVVASARNGDTRRLILALLPAAIGGFAAWAISALVALVVARRRIPASVVLVIVALPWLTSSLLRLADAPSDPAGVAAFAARADTPFGALGSLLLLGGAWNGETVPSGYGSLLTALVWLCVVLVALAAYATRPIRGLGIAAAIGFAIAAFGTTAPGVLRGAIGLWSGFALLRDGQQFVAPLAVVVAIGVGVAVDRIGRLEWAVIALPLVLLPGLAWGAGGRLTSVHYPADWGRARALVAADPGDVLVLPWEAYRGFPWNNGRTVLDPLPRFLPARVILNDGVRVHTRKGTIALAAEDPRARALDALVRGGGPLTAPLAAQNVRYVAVDGGSTLAGRLSGAEQLLNGSDLVLYRIPGQLPAHKPHPVQWLVYIAWFITFATFIWSVAVPASNLIKRSLVKEP